MKKSKFSENQIVRILSQASKGEKTVAEMALEIDTVKVVIRKNGMALPSDARERTS